MQELKNDLKTYLLTTDLEFIVNPRDVNNLKIDLIEVIKETIEAYNGYVNGGINFKQVEK